MSENAFLTALQRVTDGTFSLAELINASHALTEIGQPALARQLYSIWLGFNREHPQAFAAWFNMSALCTQIGETDAAIDALKKAVTLNPEFLPPYINLGGLMERAGNGDAALELWGQVTGRLTAITGQGAGYKLAALKQIARVLTERQQLENTELTLQECLSLDKHDREVLEQYMAMRIGQCKWPVAVPFDTVSRKELVAGIHPLSICAYTDDPLLQLGAAARYVRHATNERPASNAADRRHARIDLKGRRIRVGYVSSDLRDHAIGYLMAELFELHDRSNVEVFAYYCGRPSANEGLHARIRGAVEHWRDVRELTDDEAALVIAQDEIDILVDVNGHTRDSKTGAFARRPAPIQVNWLGYPGTMGSPYHQYLIADPFIVPEDSELYYSEKVVRLPCYQPNDRRRLVAAERPTRAEVGLPDDAFVFCTFNGPQKFTRFGFERWIEILKAVPNSVMWILEGSAEANNRLKASAKQYGVDPDRIVFAAKMANPYHLARYPLADLFLDSAPYGAHTTASDSLWMGVPVLTMAGRCFASRVCGSLVSAAGLPELVCDTSEAYVARAIELAGDPAQMAALKAKLIAGRDSCTLFDMDRLTAELEQLYAGMCADYNAGRLPRPDLTNLETYFEIGTELDHETREMTGVQDYAGLYRQELARIHNVRPLPADRRLWTAADVAAADAPPNTIEEQTLEKPARRRAGARSSKT